MDNIQRYLENKNFSELSHIVSTIINNNPYSDTLIQHYLWNEFAQKNVPFLVVLCNYIKNQYYNKNLSNILFTTRDCVFLKQLFNELYPEIPAQTLYSSRALYLFPTDDYVVYCHDNLRPDAIVIDFQGTGQSFKTLVSQLNLDPWYFLVNWNSRNKLAYSKEYLHDYNKKIILREKNFFDDAIEKLNVDLVGTYFDFTDNQPISYKYEYDPNIIKSFHECFDFFVSELQQQNIDLLKTYDWNNEFNIWMDKYYVNSQIIMSMNWIHTHFDYTKENIENIRKKYRSNDAHNS